MKTLFERNLFETAEWTVGRLSKAAKAECRKRGFKCDSGNSKSPYSRSQYFEVSKFYPETTGRAETFEVRVSDHDLPHANTRLIYLDTGYPEESLKDFIEYLEDLDWSNS